MDRLDIKSLALDITEEAYRELPHLNYSMLSAYNKSGILSFKKEKEETKSLILGSLVDHMLTSDTSWRDKYSVLDSSITQRALSVVNLMKQGFDIDYAINENYPVNWKLETKINKYKEEIGNYEDELLDGNKIMIPEEMLNKAVTMVRRIQSHPVAGLYFSENDLDISYQLKFIANIDNIDYKCMIDAIYVNHNDKTIQLIDLKTTSKHIWEFPNSFMFYNYWIQANLYRDIVQENIAEFDNYTILPYQFVVVNAIEEEPCIVYSFNYSTPQGVEVKSNIPYREIAKDVLFYTYQGHVNIPREFEGSVVNINQFLNYDRT